MKFPPFLLQLIVALSVVCAPLAAVANMASPIQRGTGTGLPFVSEHVRVLHEALVIKPLADFQTCQFEAVYDIFADTAGIRIPLLFVAYQYGDGMKVWVDGKEVTVQKLPEKFYYRSVSPLSRFRVPGGDSLAEVEVFEIEWDKGEMVKFNQDELHYFEVDLAAGAHQVRVTYAAQAWTDRSGWVKELKFLYALDPAAHWYAFGKLDVTLDASLADFGFTTNLGEPDSGTVAQRAVWHFDSLPAIKTLEIVAHPKASAWAKTLTGFGMEGFLWASGGLFALLHLLLLWRWRKRNPARKFSWIWLLGSLIVPFAAMMIYCMSYSWINAAIGPAASHFGGYFFLIFIFYPFAAIGYGLVMFFVDFLLRRRLAAGK